MIGRAFDKERAKSPGTFKGRKGPFAKGRCPTVQTLATVQETMTAVWSARVDSDSPPEDPQLLWLINCLIYAGKYHNVQRWLQVVVHSRCESDSGHAAQTGDSRPPPRPG